MTKRWKPDELSDVDISRLRNLRMSMLGFEAGAGGKPEPKEADESFFRFGYDVGLAAHRAFAEEAATHVGLREEPAASEPESDGRAARDLAHYREQAKRALDAMERGDGRVASSALDKLVRDLAGGK